MADYDNDELIEAIASELRRPVRLDASFDARVMAALEPAVIPLHQPRKSLRPWLLRPRTFSFTPLTGLAAAAALAGIAALATLRPQPPAVPTVAVAEQTVTPLQQVAFDADAPQAQSFMSAEYPDAKSIAVVGDFNEWDATKNQLTLKGGVWSGTFMLTPGLHQYQFVIDGEKWVADPAAQSVPSDFGGANSVVTVRAGGAQ